MVALLAAGENLTSRQCEHEFGITRDTASRDFALLIELKMGGPTGPWTFNELRFGQLDIMNQSSDNRQIKPDNRQILRECRVGWQSSDNRQRQAWHRQIA